MIIAVSPLSKRGGRGDLVNKRINIEHRTSNSEGFKDSRVQDSNEEQKQRGPEVKENVLYLDIGHSLLVIGHSLLKRQLMLDVK